MKTDDHSNRMNESRKLRHAVSIDNISFMSSSTSSHEQENNTIIKDHKIENNEFNNKIGSMEHLDRIDINTVNTSRINNHDEQQEHIIPWRAQLRKTNSRLSLVG